MPIAQNTPQCPPFGLYTEKISGSAFQSPRGENQQTWLYRILPSAVHEPFDLVAAKNDDESAQSINSYGKLLHIPTQVRWDPFDIDETADWIHSMKLLCGAGDVASKTGIGFFIFTAGISMDPSTAFTSTDGELLIIFQSGVLDIKTELGCLLVRPLEICVVPRGIKYNVSLPEGPVRGYAAELHQGYFTLPNLGVLGSFGCANSRDFQIPMASFENAQGQKHRIINKFKGQLYQAEQDHSPFDVVAWHGTYFPYKYDLGRFMTVGSISYDHPDPSIFTLLASSEGVAELAIFPPRWLVMENTFRPPWYHRNTMAELMGLIQGEYDARTDGGFRPGGASLHNVMCGHGPDSKTHAQASVAELLPHKVGEGSMAFVLEADVMLGLSEWAWSRSQKRQINYNEQTWQGLTSHFDPAGATIISSLLDDGISHMNGDTHGHMKDKAN